MNQRSTSVHEVRGLRAGLVVLCAALASAAAAQSPTPTRVPPYTQRFGSGAYGCNTSQTRPFTCMEVASMAACAGNWMGQGCYYIEPMSVGAANGAVAFVTKARDASPPGTSGIVRRILEITNSAGQVVARPSWTYDLGSASWPVPGGYPVVVSEKMVGQTTPGPAPVIAANPLVVSGLPNGQTFRVMLWEEDTGGRFQQRYFDVTTPGIPLPPSGLSLSPGTGVKLSWTPPDPAHQVVSTYTIRAVATDGTSTVVASGITGTSYDVPAAKLPATLTVSSVNAVAEGPASPTIYAQKLAPPSAPTLTSLTLVSGSQVSLAWTAPTAPGGTITSYVATCFNNGVKFSTTTFSGGVLSGTAFCPPVVTGCGYSISAVNAYGQGPASNTMTLKQAANQ